VNAPVTRKRGFTKNGTSIADATARALAYLNKLNGKSVERTPARTPAKKPKVSTKPSSKTLAQIAEGVLARMKAKEPPASPFANFLKNNTGRGIG